MERKRSVRRRQKPPFERIKDHCRAFTAFMFSNVGITFLVVLYIIGGKILSINPHSTIFSLFPHKSMCSQVPTCLRALNNKIPEK